MENYENKSAFESFELQLTQEAQGFLREAAKWAMFLSILGFIGLAFMLLAGLTMFAAGSALDSVATGAMAAFPASILGVVYLVMAILYFFPIYYLYKFASSTKQALLNSNTEQLTDSLRNLKSHYKFIGIITIIVIASYIVGAIVMVSIFASAAAGM